RIAFWSWASSTRTFAPFEIRVSTSESCRWLSRLASASMNVPPPASIVCFIFGLSVAPQRGCWKLFQETPTTQPPAAALPLPADGLAPPLVHALMTTAAAKSAATLRMCTDITSLMGPSSLSRRVIALGYDLLAPVSKTCVGNARPAHIARQTSESARRITHSPRRACHAVAASGTDQPGAARKPARPPPAGEHPRPARLGPLGQARLAPGARVGRAPPRASRAR